MAGVEARAVVVLDVLALWRMPWAPVPLVMARQQSANLGGLASVLCRMVTRPAGAPGMKVTWSYVEAVTQPRHAELRAVRVDEGERFAR